MLAFVDTTPLPSLDVMPAEAGTHGTYRVHHADLGDRIEGLARRGRRDRCDVSWVLAFARMTDESLADIRWGFACGTVERSRHDRRKRSDFNGIHAVALGAIHEQ